MKTLFALLALSLSATASASVCYQIYSSSNTLVWQGNTSPVPLDYPAIDDEVKRLIPGGHMIIVDDRSSPCRSFGTLPEKPLPRRTAARARSGG